MYGSSLIMLIDSPRASRIAPRHADVIPLPSEDTTPPVIKTYDVICGSNKSHFGGNNKGLDQKHTMQLCAYLQPFERRAAVGYKTVLNVNRTPLGTQRSRNSNHSVASTTPGNSPSLLQHLARSPRAPQSRGQQRQPTARSSTAAAVAHASTERRLLPGAVF